MIDDISMCWSKTYGRALAGGFSAAQAITKADQACADYEAAFPGASPDESVFVWIETYASSIGAGMTRLQAQTDAGNAVMDFATSMETLYDRRV